jgi:hypothetical protein
MPRGILPSLADQLRRLRAPAVRLHAEPEETVARDALLTSGRSQALRWRRRRRLLVRRGGDDLT